MRIFVDYHHGDLYESLLMLFEDRLGWEVYRPTGEGWAEQGYWHISTNPATIAQFLQIDASQKLTADGSHYQWQGGSHPTRVHKLVTVEQFGVMSWDYMMASVSQHMEIYSRMAKTLDAKFVAQIGNAHQPVPWQLDPYVLASARVPVTGARHVHFHPEFSLKDYQFIESPNPRRVVNLMNCLPHLPDQYAEWKLLQTLLKPDGFEFKEYGTLGEHGIVSPSSRVAAEMQQAGWGYHNKHADGYGFVIHQWQACGRPIIGRSGPYKGTTGEPIWRVLPSLDLDGQSVDAVADIMASAARDTVMDGGFYQQACRAMARDFRSRINFHAEAQAVREMLVG